MKEIKTFHSLLYSTTDKIKQDTFLLKCCQGHKPKRTKNPNSHKHNVSITYNVLISDGKFVRVCKNAFINITNISRDRIERVIRNFVGKSEMPTEKRGGDKVGIKNDPQKDAIKMFIESLKCVESHYCRSKTGHERVYLPCELNFKKLWQMYQNSTSPKNCVKLDFFRTFVKKIYNLAFGTPKSDVCSTCLRFQENVKAADLTAEQSVDLKTEQRLHELKAAAFYNKLKSTHPNTEIFSFDCQKNLAVPKLPDQACYFSQQINYYNFTIVHGTSKAKLNLTNVTSYTWTEVDAAKDSNAIASAVYTMLTNYTFENTIEKIDLFADGCGGQNKNVIMMTMLSFWLINKAPAHIKTIEMIFPIVGHSFMPPDRVFGLVEQEVKKKAIFTKPDQYTEIIARYSTVRNVNEWTIFNWKAEAKKHVKLPGSWHFQFNKAKRFIFTKDANNYNTVLVRGELNYNVDSGVGKAIIKKGHKINTINPSILPFGRNLAGDKSSIDRLLVTHYGDKWKNRADLSFLKKALSQKAEDLEGIENQNLQHDHQLQASCSSAVEEFCV